MQEPTQPDDEVRCHRVSEAAEFLTTSQEFVYMKIRSGELRATKLGNRTVIRHRDLLDYLDRQPLIESA